MKPPSERHAARVLGLTNGSREYIVEAGDAVPQRSNPTSTPLGLGGVDETTEPPSLLELDR